MTSSPRKRSLERILAKLGRDLPTSQRNDSSCIADPDAVYSCLERGIELAKSMISFLIHIHLIADVVGTSLNDGGPVFLALCLLPIVARSLMRNDLWSKAYIVQAVNKFYLRKLALARVADTDLKPEVMAGGIGSYLLNEYDKAQDGLGNISDDSPEYLYTEQREAVAGFFLTLCSDGPMLYFAFLALVDPSKLSIVQLAVLEQTAFSLRYTFSSIAWLASTFPKALSRMEGLYMTLDIQNQMKDGETPYPRPGSENNTGMSLELRNVSFSYPSTKSERAALTDVSFTVQPGQLVVIVGANGSGKSTVLKLLSRYYDTTSGTILVDGLPIEEYCMDDLRKGIAMLTQEHELFPLSVEENIRLGSSEEEAMKDEEKLKESTKLAGAEGIVKNFSEGFNTVLEPVSIGYLSYCGQGNKELEDTYKEMEKSANVSGNARTFMRLLTSPIKLVSVDEPSSALDPEGEYQLFKKLREARKGRTMIFVTHRFGHLTRYADLIVCIKDGAVVETGTHADMLARGGEYAHLYNVQAQAFATT
ncbi:P-loop containing nucleoside triphosphate hydrolase protein [Melanogaster broomeanus]|nr:P-loop containing nucleoside triphosphate hydrolase protein [Melanogaster broomeanus]